MVLMQNYIEDSSKFNFITKEVFIQRDILFLIYLQSGSVYIFGESVAPPGGDNKCFIWVYLETARAAMLFTNAAENYTVLILHSTPINLINIQLYGRNS